MNTHKDQTILDLVAIGLGPFNLGLAALLDPIPEYQAVFLEQKNQFDWHPGMLIEGTTLQVPFLADLVTMVDPTNRYSFLNYLRAQGRLYSFYFLEKFHIPRKEYNHYCQWVSEQLESCQFGQKVMHIEWVEDNRTPHYQVHVQHIESGNTQTYLAHNLVLGVGSIPSVHAAFRGLPSEDVFHSASFLDRLDRCRKARSITIIGSGQSAAEIFYTLLQEQESVNFRLDWFTRSHGFFPMEYSKLGLEHFSPDYIHYFISLPQEKRDQILPTQDLLYKGISAETIATIYDLLYERTIASSQPPIRLQAKTEIQQVILESGRYRLQCRQWEEDREFEHESEVVILATGYDHAIPDCIQPLQSLIQWDEKGRYQVEDDYQIRLHPPANPIYIQNGEIHTHGVGAPDLGLGAHRNAVIINSLLQKEIYPVTKRNVFQRFN